MPIAEIKTLWGKAIQSHNRLVLEVPRRHGASTFLREQLATFDECKAKLLLSEHYQKQRLFDQERLERNNITHVHARPPLGMRRLDCLFMDQPVDPMHPRPYHQCGLVRAWKEWEATNPRRIIVMATVTPVNAPLLADMFPAEEGYQRIQYGYTGGLEGLEFQFGRELHVSWHSELWTNSRLEQRKKDIGPKKFGWAFQVIPEEK